MITQLKKHDELKELNVEVKSSHEKIKPTRPMLTVEVEILSDTDAGLNQLRFERMTKRGTLVHFWGFSHDPERKILKMNISTEVGEAFLKTHGYLTSPVQIANTFSDFCWIMSEGTKNESLLEVKTPLREGKVELGDLTWVLPSKFADDLIEAVHVMNATVLEGMMMDAILYGPRLDVDA